MSQVPSCMLIFEYDARQWSKWRRWMIAFVIWNLIAPIDISLTLYSGMQQQIQDYFQTTKFIATLGGSIFGPLIGAPLSELYGRRPVYIGSSVGFVIFSLGAALSPTIVSLLTCRALAGLIGSAVFSLYGGSLSDMFSPDERGPFVALFTSRSSGCADDRPSAVFAPRHNCSLALDDGFHRCLGCESSRLWLSIFLRPKRPQYREGLAKQQGEVSPKIFPPTQQAGSVWSKALLTPITMIHQEPIVLWTAIYHAFVYGLLFLLLEAYPHVYSSHYSMSREEAGLVFIAPWLGNILGVLVYFRFLKPQYAARQYAILVQSGGKREISPEGRLQVSSLRRSSPRLACSGSLSQRIQISTGSFPCYRASQVGMGMTLLQLSLFNYYIDLYPTRSASVIAANCAVRNIVSTIFPSIGLYRVPELASSYWSMASGFALRVRWAKQDSVDVSHTASCLDIVTPLLGQSPENTYGSTSTSTSSN
ncbi:major facilitator superfamily domain-containing protein [Melanogaster broomeanus]|nr:major facilitator superfamily domain-containing protein [Melanogaster broomeanus]